MRKITIFLVILCLFLAVSCEGEEDSFSLNYEISYSTDWTGESFTILQGATETEPMYYRRDTLLADSALRRVSEVAALHNCEIDFRYGGSEDATKSLLNLLFAIADTSTDIVFTFQYCMNQIANIDGFVDFETLTHIIDIHDENKWGAPNVWELMISKGVLYGVTPVSWLQKEPTVYYPIVFNADITQSFGYSDLREFYETNTWTREKMLEVIVNCTDNTLSVPIKGMAACLKHFIRSALLNNGTQFAVFNEDVTEYYCGWTDPAGLEALTWVRDVLLNYGDYMYEFANTSYGDWLYINPFLNGEAAMLMTRSMSIYDQIAFEIENFGIVPFPVGPYGEEGKWVGFYESVYSLAIPITAKEIDASAILINEIFEPLDEYPTQDSLKEYYTKNIFSDERDYAIIEKMNQNCKYSFWPDGGDTVIHNILTNLYSKTPAELFEMYEHSSDTCIIEQMIPSILTVRRLTGDESYN